MWVGVGARRRAVRRPSPSCCGSSTSSCPSASRRASRRSSALVAVAMVTYMIVWMRRPRARPRAASCSEQRRGRAGRGLGRGARRMAFLAVLREGFETAVFLLAAFQDATDPAAGAASAPCSASLVAVALGYGIYRGGVRINLSRFFRVTGVVLVLVAAGLVASALHTADEAGWVIGGQRAGARPQRRRPPGHGLGVAHHRHARHPAAARRWSRSSAGCSTRSRCSPSSSRPTRVRPRVRATPCAGRRRRRGAGRRSLVGTLGGDKRDAPRRSPAASAGGRTVNVAHHRRGLRPGDADSSPPAPATFVVTNRRVAR